jgi:broad specificity phosphatase PhoE
MLYPTGIAQTSLIICRPDLLLPNKAFKKLSGWDAISSPLERALCTAQIASRIASVPYEIQDNLIEWQPGDTEETVTGRIWSVFERASQLNYQFGPVGLVTHGGPIAMLLLALGMSTETLAAQRVFDHGNPLPTAGVWQVSQDDERCAWELKLVFKPELVNLTDLV